MAKVVVIGAGPAGMTAAIYAARAEKTVAIIDKNGFGGQIAKSPKVENYPGFASSSGLDLATNIYEQMSGLEKVEHIINVCQIGCCGGRRPPLLCF